jgi:4'-phosphopantetheinyl transferase EntD
VIEMLVPAPVEAVDVFGDRLDDVYPEEEHFVRRAVAKRRHEFLSVRACARTALARLGVTAGPLIPGRGGAPVWPVGVVGSMSHCAGYRAAAVAHESAYASVGIDAEPDEPLPPGVLGMVALPRERAWCCPRDARPVCLDRLLFSAKEAVYKAWYPLTGRVLEFTDVEVTVDEKAGRFHAHVAVEIADTTRGPTSFDGRWLVARGLVVTTVVVPGSWRRGRGAP